MRSVSYFITVAVGLMSSALNTGAQSPDYAQTKEKVYVHTDHVLYQPGQSVYFKTYVVNAADQKPNRQSHIVRVELISPSGTVLQTQNFPIKVGSADGMFRLLSDIKGGVYKIRAYTQWMQNENKSTWFEKELIIQQYIAPRLLMKLDFPKKGYGPGDDVAAEFSARNLGDQPIRNREITVAVMVAGRELTKHTAKTDKDGKALINFRLPEDLASTDGLLIITIAEAGNTESVSRSIPIVLNKIDLQFLPEGGTFVNGIATNLAFKAINEFGKPTDVRGEIIDDLGNRVAEFESFHFGMGKVNLTPAQGRNYFAKITNPANISDFYILPKAADNGVVLNISADSLLVKVTIKASGSGNFILTGHTKNREFYRSAISYTNGTQTIQIPTSQFPIGITKFTLLNSQEQPLAERICFLNKNKLLKVEISTDKNSYLPREEVKMKLRTYDDKGPVPSTISLSIVDDKLWTMADDKQDHINSWLLMNSELSGEVEEPQFYFKPDEERADPALDLVMLTNGYRYFDFIEPVLQSGQLKFAPETGSTLRGIVTDNLGNPVKSLVFLVHPNGDKTVASNTTDTSGVFIFSGLQQGKNYSVIAQSLVSGKEIRIKLGNAAVQKDTARTLPVGKLPQQFINLIPFDPVKDEAALPVPAISDTIGSVMFNNLSLSEVVVTGLAVKSRTLAYSVSTQQLDGAVLTDLGNALSGRVAGLQITSSAAPGSATHVMIRGYSSIKPDNQPLIVIDGMPTTSTQIPMHLANIQSIEVQKDAAATAIYGSRAANGVIIISTGGYLREKIKFRLKKKPTGYATAYVYVPSDQYHYQTYFYAPRYRSTSTHKRNDFRETIYWNPTIQTDENGEANISFYNSDASTSFRAIAEGIGYHGRPGRIEFTYSAQAPVSIDAKIPQHLTVGDKALIPLVIKNNKNNPIEIKLSVSPLKGATIGTYEKKKTIADNSFARILVPVTIDSIINSNIYFNVEVGRHTETLMLPINAGAKGFPKNVVISGDSSKSHDFEINNPYPGSVSGKLSLYTSLESKFLDDIEQMIREPYGCFEQTSSVTYPNIFILKFLKHKKTSNPKVEDKAVNYIEKGYRRLLGFEFIGGGFGWFAGSTPDIALTAYGLMEFSDMKEFVNVSPSLLMRTRDYILKRRDGKGGFISTKNYQIPLEDSIAAHCYIVYALTHASFGNEIWKEYRTAVDMALKSNDAYALALTALAASNLKNERDFGLLMEMLNKNHSDLGLAAKTSFTGSRYNSLKSETLALYILALAREKSPDVRKMATLVSQLLGSRNYFGYGSTQATVLSLNAIIEYSKLVEKKLANTEVAFIVNGRKVSTGDVTDYVKTGSNTLGVKFERADDSHPYILEVNYTTDLPSNSEKAELALQTKLDRWKAKVGETVRLTVEVTNKRAGRQPMALTKIGIPAGLNFQHWQLKELMDKNQVSYYELFDNYLVLYWTEVDANEKKTIHLDLKADVPGTYRGRASNVYLYYTPEDQHWNEGMEVTIEDN